MVSGHSKSIGIPRVDGLSTGPSGFGAPQSWIENVKEINKYKFVKVM